MYNFRYLRRLSAFIIVLVQIFGLWVYFCVPNDEPRKEKTKGVAFFKKGNYSETVKQTYHTIFSQITLPVISTRSSFVDFNSSLCFVNGTDIKSMQRTKNNWQCNCLPQWHGKDCSQPEVVWRALLAKAKSLRQQVLRKTQRRLIYIFEVNKFVDDLTELRLNELGDVVDLFIFVEDMSEYMQKKLNNGYLKKFHRKILYINGRLNKTLWFAASKAVMNLQDDDLVLWTGLHDIPNKYPLIYFKYYDKWPEPLAFRMKWNVYGFFWMHPSKTYVSASAQTVAYLNENLEDFGSPPRNPFVLGDLNHFGGWFCEFCLDAASLIINYLNAKSTNTPVRWENVKDRTIDNAYVEDLIENGIYLDGKTVLSRAYRFRDNYYAPQYAEDQNWKYDYLLYNMYSKIDY